MSFFKQAKSGGNGGGDDDEHRPFLSPAKEPQALIDYYEGHNQHMQAVRIRLWNGLPQRDTQSHRDMVAKWLASGVARDNPPPPVPYWVKRGEPIEEVEERRMSRAMWMLERGKVSQQTVDGWPKRWQQVGTTQGWLDANGTLRTFTSGEA